MVMVMVEHLVEVMVEDIKGDQLLQLPHLLLASVMVVKMLYDMIIRYVFHVRKALPQLFILELVQSHLR